MAERQGIEPLRAAAVEEGASPAGSDDHSGAYTATAFTITPLAWDVDEFLARSAAASTRPDGACGGSVLMGHAFYHIAYSYYQDRFVRGNAATADVVGELSSGCWKRPAQEPAGWTSRAWPARGSCRGKCNKLSETEQQLVADFSPPVLRAREPHTAPAADGRPPHLPASPATSAIRWATASSSVHRVRRQGPLMESLQTVASLARWA